MKTVFLILSLMMVGCTVSTEIPASVGDCYLDQMPTGPMIFKVLKVGTYSLEVMGSDGRIYTAATKTIAKKVDCFDRFPNK